MTDMSLRSSKAEKLKIVQFTEHLKYSTDNTTKDLSVQIVQQGISNTVGLSLSSVFINTFTLVYVIITCLM